MKIGFIYKFILGIVKDAQQMWIKGWKDQSLLLFKDFLFALDFNNFWVDLMPESLTGVQSVSVTHR